MNDQEELEVFDQYVRDIMKTPAGKAFIWELLSRCGIYSSVAEPFQCGKRDIGIQIIEMLDNADLSIYPELLLEKREHE